MGHFGSRFHSPGPKKGHKLAEVSGEQLLFFLMLGKIREGLEDPEKGSFFLEVFSSDSPGTKWSKKQHFADFLYKFAVLEDHKRMGSSLFVLPGKSVAPFILDPSIFFRQGLGDGTWLCGDCDFRPE